MYKSFKFVLFNESFPNPAKFEIRQNVGQSRISAGFVKKIQISAGAGAELQYSPTCNISKACTCCQKGMKCAGWADFY